MAFLGTLIMTLRNLAAGVKPVPADDEAQELFGLMRGTVTIHGDLADPIDEVWQADA